MPVHIDWTDIAIRMLSAILAAAAIGWDRGERGRAAGLRTTLLVTLAACVAMIQTNLLLPTGGKQSDSFAQFDVMRIPLGILTGVGFIGAGSILRRGRLVHGVTTAATMWFATVVGLCFGGGQLGIGWASTAVGIMVLLPLKEWEARRKTERHATLLVVAGMQGPGEAEIERRLSVDGYRLVSCALRQNNARNRCKFICAVHWHDRKTSTAIPPSVRALGDLPEVLSVSWIPESEDA